MLQATVRDFLAGKLKQTDTSHAIYLVRANEQVLYVGKSIHVLTRLLQHLCRSETADWIGQVIWLNQPQSLDWSIELFTCEECLPLVLQLYPKHPQNRLPSMKAAEMAMIAHHHPCFNAQNNVSP